jgi:hypothetical protein
VLTQISLLLSLWSPDNSGFQNNSYWLDMAFKHATAGMISESRYEDNTQPCRRKLLWWCCLVRDRLLALGMRRPHRLHTTSQSQNIITEKDFGLEAQRPYYTDLKSKRVAMVSFIWFCKLSNIMASIAIFQRQNKFSRDWNGENSKDSSSELDQVRQFDRELETWRDEFESAILDVLGNDSPARAVFIPVALLRIIQSSLLAGIYQPYLHLSSASIRMSAEGNKDPLQRIKEGSRGVAITVADVMSSRKSDSIPLWL